ncbi:MAG: hypothetical protein HZB21_01325 [Deltaproteobacteria bacterium]|nr:hypothetical protein [Deltaproteobacteria bacterium]
MYKAMRIFSGDTGLMNEMSKKIFFTALLLILPFYAYADEAAIKAGESYDVILLPDYHLLSWHTARTQGGYIVAGTVYDDSGPRQRALAVKTGRGKVLWKLELNDGRSSAFHKVITVEDAAVLGGSVDAAGGGPSEESTGLVMKLKPDGATEWDSRVRFGRVTRVMDVARTQNGVVAVGRVRQGEHEDSGFIVEFDAKGRLLWTKQQGRWLDFVYPLKGGGFLAGNFGWLVRLGAKGDTLWERSLGEDELRVIGATCKAEQERIWGAAISTSGEMKAVKKYLTAGADKGLAGVALIDGNDTFAAFGAAAGPQDYGVSIWVFEYSFKLESADGK